jgi:hypothetical protein
MQRSTAARGWRASMPTTAALMTVCAVSPHTASTQQLWVATTPDRKPSTATSSPLNAEASSRRSGPANRAGGS